MDTEELLRVMTRYLEDKGFWMGIVPVALAMADRAQGGLLELAYYVLDQGTALTQNKLVEKAVSIGGRAETRREPAVGCRQTA